ncbi:hypothetical protein [Alcanivorax sp.]|jgi:hypothetical protein
MCKRNEFLRYIMGAAIEVIGLHGLFPDCSLAFDACPLTDKDF